LTDTLRIRLTPGRVGLVLGGVAVLLVVLHLIGLFFVYILGWDGDVANFLFNHVNLANETNLPTMFQTALMLASSALLAIIWRARRAAGNPHRLWLILAILFALLAIDEFMSHHEGLTVPVRAMLSGPSGLLYYAWVVPYALAALLLAAAYAPLIWRLGGRIRNLVILAGGTYLTGALGFELLGGLYLGGGRDRDLIYFLLVAYEETLEAVGLILFVYALLLLIQRDHRGLVIELPPEEAETRPVIPRRPAPE
jgi:hypothetical protein